MHNTEPGTREIVCLLELWSSPLSVAVAAQREKYARAVGSSWNRFVLPFKKTYSVYHGQDSTHGTMSLGGSSWSVLKTLTAPLSLSCPPALMVVMGVLLKRAMSQRKPVPTLLVLNRGKRISVEEGPRALFHAWRNLYTETSSSEAGCFSRWF